MVLLFFLDLMRREAKGTTCITIQSAIDSRRVRSIFLGLVLVEREPKGGKGKGGVHTVPVNNNFFFHVRFTTWPASPANLPNITVNCNVAYCTITLSANNNLSSVEVKC